MITTPLFSTPVKIIALSILATASVVLTTRYLGGPSLSISQITTAKDSTFDVTGESKVTTVPDQAEVRLGIAVTEPSVKPAQDKANSIINTINTKLAELGITKDHIKTENYFLNPNYDYTPGAAQRITSYSVNANLVVTITDFAKLNQAIDAATGAGANQISGITFSLSDDKKAEVEKEARTKAIANAKDRGETLARLAGMRLGKIVNVKESPQSSVTPPFMAAEFAKGGAGGGAPTNIEPGSTTFSYTVTLSYETL